MADEELDESKDESDENLDEELDDTSDTESGDDSTESETSEDEKDQSKDTESDESSSQDEESTDDKDSEDDESDDESESDKSKRTPEQIAKYERKRRKKAERELRDLRRTNTQDTSKDGPTLPPGGLAERVWKTIVKVDIEEIAQSDPTVMKRAGMIKNIIFKEMPWLQKDPNGVKTANEIALGRTVKPTPGTEQSQTVQRKTSPPDPRRPQTKSKFKVLSTDEVNRLSETQLRAYEDALAKHLAESNKS